MVPESARGFTLLPVVLAMSLVAAIAYLLNRDNGTNASLIGAQADREHARYAAEAGLQAVNATIQGLGCAGSYPVSGSPLIDASFGGAAYSAHASSATGSPLTLTATGTYNGVSVTLARPNAYVYQAGLRTWVAQPGPVAGKDAFVDEDQKGENYGAQKSLQIDRNEENALIAFNLSPLPAGSRIVRAFSGGALQPGATISLYQDNSSATGSFSVMLITEDWVAGTSIGSPPTKGSPGATWDKPSAPTKGSNWARGPGAGYDPRPLLVFPEPSSGWAVVDITDAAVGWRSGVYPNFGVWLVPVGTAKDYDFTSSDEDDPFKTWRRPKFTVKYLLPCGLTAPADAIEA